MVQNESICKMVQNEPNIIKMSKMRKLIQNEQNWLIDKHLIQNEQKLAGMNQYE